MLFRICLFTVFLIYLIVLDCLVSCSDRYNLLQIKQRFPRSNSKTNNNNEEFEKFFLKASKSVPRIGRRGSMNGENYYGENSFTGNKHQLIKFPYTVQPKRSANRNLGAPFWSDIAQIYEYNPDLPNVIQYLSNLEQEQGDDPSIYDINAINGVRYKKNKIMRNNDSQNKEVPEYRLQAEVK